MNYSQFKKSRNNLLQKAVEGREDRQSHDLAAQRLKNKGGLQKQRLMNQGALAQQGLANQGKLKTQKLRNKGSLQTQKASDKASMARTQLEAAVKKRGQELATLSSLFSEKQTTQRSDRKNKLDLLTSALQGQEGMAGERPSMAATTAGVNRSFDMLTGQGPKVPQNLIGRTYRAEEVNSSSGPGLASSTIRFGLTRSPHSAMDMMQAIGNKFGNDEEPGQRYKVNNKIRSAPKKEEKSPSQDIYQQILSRMQGGGQGGNVSGNDIMNRFR